jgi:hypothetical protein
MINPNWKTEGLPTIVSDKQVTVILPSGQPRSVRFDDDVVRYNSVLQAIREDNWEQVPAIIDAATAIETQFKAQGFEVKSEFVYVNGEKLPDSLSNRILAFAKAKLPVEPLLKFWDNLNKNPSFHSVQQLHSFLEKNDHPITDDGRFVAYRSVTCYFKDKRTKTMDNSPGKTVTMKRNQVDENPNRTCSNGLHVANYKYASDFGAPSDKLVLVYINPKDVVAVPNDYNGAKMRVCEFYVVNEIENEITDTPLVNTDDNSMLTPDLVDCEEDEDLDADSEDEDYDEDFDDDDDEDIPY